MVRTSDLKQRSFPWYRWTKCRHKTRASYRGACTTRQSVNTWPSPSLLSSSLFQRLLVRVSTVYVRGLWYRFRRPKNPHIKSWRYIEHCNIIQTKWLHACHLWHLPIHGLTGVVKGPPTWRTKNNMWTDNELRKYHSYLMKPLLLWFILFLYFITFPSPPSTSPFFLSLLV